MASKINVKVGETPFEIAQQFLGSAPVDLLGMADALGIDVNMHATMCDPQASGSIRRLPNGRYFIEVNGSDFDLRRRFTLAHELAHYILHRDIIDQRALVDDAMWRSGAGEQVEYQANRMAADLLMPAGLVRTLWNAGVENVSVIARTFQASEVAARIRLEQLGLLPPAWH